MAKKNDNRTNPVILVIIYACMLYAMYNSLSSITLGLWGQSVMGTVDRYDSRLDDSRAQTNRSRTVSKGYSFIVNGKEYRGFVIYSSDEAWPSLRNGQTRSERINYLSFCPYINKPSALTDFDEMGGAGLLYHIFAPVGCLLLMILVTRTMNRGIRRKKTVNKAVKEAEAPQDYHTRSDNDMFCSNCGNKLSEGAAFCTGCGTRMQNTSGICAACGAAIPDDADFCINCGTARNSSAAPTTPRPAYHPQQQQPQPAYPQQQQPQLAAPQQDYIAPRPGLVGFSERSNSPEILAAAQKNRKTSIGCLWVLVLVPLIGFPIAGLLMDDFPVGESLVIGVGIALIMLVVNLLALRKTRQPMWEGAVVNKYSKERSEHRGGEDDNYRTYTEYTTVINTDAGKKKTIVEKDSGRDMYDYLDVGDKVRFHPKFGTYEKYDKSKDRIIYCNVCSMMNPMQNDRCKRCNNLLFK